MLMFRNVADENFTPEISECFHKDWPAKQKEIVADSWNEYLIVVILIVYNAA